MDTNRDGKVASTITLLESFTVSCTALPAGNIPDVRAVQGHCKWHLTNGGNSHRSREPTMQCFMSQSQPIFRLVNHKMAMPNYWRHCLIPMGILTDTQNCGLPMRRECQERFSRPRLQRKSLVIDPGMQYGTCVTHVPWCISGPVTRGGGPKRSRHSRRMRNPRLCVSGKRPIDILMPAG